MPPTKLSHLTAAQNSDGKKEMGFVVVKRSRLQSRDVGDVIPANTRNHVRRGMKSVSIGMSDLTNPIFPIKLSQIIRHPIQQKQMSFDQQSGTTRLVENHSAAQAAPIILGRQAHYYDVKKTYLDSMSHWGISKMSREGAGGMSRRNIPM